MHRDQPHITPSCSNGRISLECMALPPRWRINVYVFIFHIHSISDGLAPEEVHYASCVLIDPGRRAAANHGIPYG